MWTVVDSPIGELRVAADEGAVSAIDFAPFPERTGIGERADDEPVLVEARRQLAAYFAGTATAFDLPLAPVGTPFQRRVWDVLATIGYGETASYGQVARSLGMTGHGSRAVGLANGRNPIPVVVPCHRVVGADGSLTGYAGGVERKQVLLELERGSLF